MSSRRSQVIITKIPNTPSAIAEAHDLARRVFPQKRLLESINPVLELKASEEIKREDLEELSGRDLQKMDSDLLEDLDLMPSVKRQRLDHLSNQEKLVRRKLKNRVAAQEARDRQKNYVEQLENKIRDLHTKYKTLQAKYGEMERNCENLMAENRLLKSRIKANSEDIVEIVDDSTWTAVSLTNDPSSPDNIVVVRDEKDDLLSAPSSANHLHKSAALELCSLNNMPLQRDWMPTLAHTFISYLSTLLILSLTSTVTKKSQAVPCRTNALIPFSPFTIKWRSQSKGKFSLSLARNRLLADSSILRSATSVQQVIFKFSQWYRHHYKRTGLRLNRRQLLALLVRVLKLNRYCYHRRQLRAALAEKQRRQSVALPPPPSSPRQ